MNLSAPFVARPVATTLLAIGVVLAGVVAFTQLPVSPLRKVSVSAGRSAAAAQITKVMFLAILMIFRTSAAPHLLRTNVQLFRLQ